MSALIDSLDTVSTMQLGENNHVEHGWSNQIEEKIVQFDFQCVRTTPQGIGALEIVLDELLQELSTSHSNTEKESKRKQLLCILYKMIGKTRDVEGGKGEYAISYMMIWKWHQYFPKLAELALALFVFEPCRVPEHVINYSDTLKQIDRSPYGSWKDIKYLCNYLREKCAADNPVQDHPIFRRCIEYINIQLRRDAELYESAHPEASKTKLSLVSKWIPRESSKKFGWFTNFLAKDYFKEFLVTVNQANPTSLRRAEQKCLTRYRILCATLNRHIDTVQIKQAGCRWADIDHSKTTSITMQKNRRAFMNLSVVSPHVVRSVDPDRVQCAKNLQTYLQNLVKSGKEVKGKNIGLDKFASDAYNLTYYGSQEEIDMLNSQWRDNANQKNANGLGPMIAMVDMSGSMSGDPMNAAVALGCRVAEKSILGKRVMTFSATPEWINLDQCDIFTKMVKKIYDSSNTAGMNTDFYKALDMILGAIEKKRIPPEDVENMILAIFSDMQIDDNLCQTYAGTYYDSRRHQSIRDSARAQWDTMYVKIQQKYADTGMRLYGKPLNPPHILFWNLRSTGGFPALSSQGNMSMMSGFDPTVLNMFCELGIEALRFMTPFNTLLKLLDNERYYTLEVLCFDNL